jgi:hypothetical protein
MGDLSDFERGQIVGARLTGTSVTKTATLLRVSTAKISKVISAYTNHVKTTSAKRNSRRKSTLTERDRRVLKGLFREITEILQHRWQQNWISISKTLFPQKLSDVSFTNATSTVGLQLLNLWLLKVMLRCVNDGVTIMKPGHETNRKALVMWPDNSSFTLFPTSRRVGIWRTPKEAYNPERLVPTVNHEGNCAMVWTAVSWYSILLAPLLPFMADLLQRSTRTDWVIRCIPWSRRYFRTATQFYSTTLSPFTQLGLFSHGLMSMKVNLTSSLASTITRFEHHRTTVVSFRETRAGNRFPPQISLEQFEYVLQE